MTQQELSLNPDLATAHFLDRQPILFMGCTPKEVMFAGAVAFFGGIGGLTFGFGLLGVVVGIRWLFWLGALGLPAFPFVAGAILKAIGRKKRGKPDGYYDLLLLLARERLMVILGMRPDVILFAGRWGIDRRVL
jgi:hypothetical protein